MKSKCGRFEFLGEMGIFDSMSKRYVTLDGQIVQVKGQQEVQFSEATIKLVNEFIAQVTPYAESIVKDSKQDRLKRNFLHEFNKTLNEGYHD